MLAVNYNLLIEVIDLFLPSLSLLLDHIVTANEHCLKVGWVREGLLVLHL